MRFNRVENTKRNVIWGISYRLIAMLVPFLMRTVVIYSLGTIYLGLNSLFTSILNALNLAELGVGSAMVFMMYDPVARDDKEKICALLNFYKTAYFIIGLVVTILGFSVLPFLNYFIKGEYPSDIILHLIYIIQLLSTSFGYFFMAYKGSVVNVYQRNDVISKYSLLTDIGMYLGQIVALLGFKNFYIYTLFILLRTVVYNLLVSKYVDRNFQEIKAKGRIQKTERRKIFVKIGALMGNKIASVIINSIDNIFISMFIGLQMVAIFNNYSYIVTAVTTIFTMIISGLSAIIGNYIVVETDKKTANLFYTIHFLLCFMICICCTCFLNLFQPFMTLWLGNESLLPWLSVVLFVVYFFSIRIRTAGQLFLDASGLWEKTVTQSYIVIIIDLIIDIILLKRIGVNGALISTIVCMIFAFIYESIIIFKYCIRASIIHYYFNTFIYSIAILISCFLSHFFCERLTITSLIGNLLISFAISILTSVICYILCTVWTKEFKEGISFAKRFVRR